MPRAGPVRISAPVAAVAPLTVCTVPAHPSRLLLSRHPKRREKPCSCHVTLYCIISECTTQLFFLYLYVPNPPKMPRELVFSLTRPFEYGILSIPLKGFIFLCKFSRSFYEGGKKFRQSGGADMRVKVTLACTECKQRNYNTMKNKKNDPDRLEMNKYCKFCRKHTSHKETK